MGEADIAELSRLFDAAAAADGHRAIGEHKWLDLVQGGREGFAGFVACETGRRPVIGYAQVSRGADRNWAIEYVVHPGWRTREPGLRADLVKVALAEIARQGGGHVHLWVPKPGDVDDEVAKAVGLRRGRDLYQMRRSLPVGRLPSIATRPFRVGLDEEDWLKVNNAAFSTHPEQGSWTIETIRGRESQPWFDPEGFLVHEVEAQMAGFCWTKLQEADGEAVGEIYVVAVAPEFKGRGLGRELVLAGLDYLAGKGLETAMLYVDRDNESARGLYTRLGFADDHVDRAYTGDVGR